MAPAMTPTERLIIESALRELNADFCYFLDQRLTDKLADLFTDNALYTHDRRESRGRKAIHDLFSTRNALGTRTSRHLQTGLRLAINDTQSARGNSICMTIAADETPPVTHVSPHLIADFSDDYLLCEDGYWRISRRHIERIFVAPENMGPIGSVPSADSGSQPSQ